MYSNKSFKKWIAPISLASLLVASQLPATITAHAEENTTVTTTVGKDVSYQNALSSSSAFLLSITPNPTFADCDIVTDLARANLPIVPKDYYEQYYQSLVNELDTKQGAISDSPSAYAKQILAVTAIGKDAENVGGYNLIQLMADAYLTAQEKDLLYDMDNYYMLYALDAKSYHLPAGERYQALSREQLVSKLLASQFTDEDENNGAFGWDKAWGADKDATSMAVTALANYSNQESVQQAIEKAYSYLGNQINERAGFVGYYGDDSPETVSQLIISLTANKVDPKTDVRFVKENGAWTISNLLTTYDSITGGFKNAPKAKEPNVISSDQANRALQAYDRFVNGKNSFYNMTTDANADELQYDVKAPEKPTAATVADNATTITGKTEPYATITVKNGSKIIGTAQSNFTGKYSVKIKQQKAGTPLQIVATDLGKNNSGSITAKVVDKTAPKISKIGQVSDRTTKITGTAEAKAKVYVIKNNKVIKTGTASTKGAFSLAIPKQKAGTVLTVYVQDSAKNKSKIVKIKVVDKTAPKAPKVHKVTKKSTRITGTAEAKSKVYVVKNKKIIKYGTVSSKGKFSLSIKKQKVGTKLTIYVKDAAKNKSANKTIIVKSK
ncbi:Ig-like domain-containing protein [Rummeliibacillus sp. SL167]|uniref:Ig-like domain-containing protein n=1 Tax=Rummeliibacillus sp. SL167 TaxID=2579792 RepID=UPI001644DD68|nr:Ig-like domain-containing protein [Rummeliibacillus sp. SL167]